MFFPQCFRLTALLALTASPILAQCTFQLSPTSASFGTSSNDSTVIVTASASNCAWTSRSNTSWITISFGQTGTGNGTVGFTVTQNNTPATRTGSLTIANITFNVTQAAAPCSYTLMPASVSVPPGGGSGTINIVTACLWTPSSNSDWLTVSGSGLGNGTAQYSAAANSTGASRTGSITIGTQTFTVTQQAACTFTLNPFSIQADPAAGATGTFTVTASSTTCAWTASSANPDFLTVTTGPSGTGNGTIGYIVQPNHAATGRSGAIMVGNSSFTVYQPGGQPCSYALSAPSANFFAGGGTSSFTVASTCAWSPSTAYNWISIGGPVSSTGNGTVTFTVSSNQTAATRIGTILVASQAFTITQTGLACSVTANPLSIQIPSTGAQGSINIMAPDSCNWNASAAPSWIVLSNSSGTAQGIVSYAVAANPTSQVRIGTITIANQIVSVSQEPTVCGQTLTPANANVSAIAGTYSVNVATSCNYAAVSNSGWIKLVSNASGTGTADVGYAVSANNSPEARTGTIAVGSQLFSVSQSGAGCTLTLSPGAADVEAKGGLGSFAVMASGSCRWQASTDAGWVHVTYESVNGNGKVTFVVDAADQPNARQARIFVADQTFQLRQAARSVLQISSAGVLNAASFVSGAVSPGEIITVFGDGLGPAVGAELQLTADRQSIANLVAGTRVLFDGLAAPLIYVSNSQVSAIVPYALDGQASTRMQVEYQGVLSSEVTLNVVPTNPAIFTIDSSGSGQGAILNQDTNVNSALNPAQKGSIVVLFATGEGQTTPGGSDGALANKRLPKPVAPVAVQIGGIDAKVLYAGAAPGLPAGVFQVNVQVPGGAPSGAVPVILRVGTASGRPDVTLAIR